MYSYDNQCNPNLNGLSPYELVFGRKSKVLNDLETDPNVKVSVVYKEYCELLNKGWNILQKLLFNLMIKKRSMLNREREFFQYEPGGLIYIISFSTGQLRTSSREVSVKYVGPEVLYKVNVHKSFLLCTLE